MERAYSVSYLISYWNRVLLVSFNTTGAHIHTHTWVCIPVVIYLSSKKLGFRVSLSYRRNHSLMPMSSSLLGVPGLHVTITSMMIMYSSKGKEPLFCRQITTTESKMRLMNHGEKLTINQRKKSLRLLDKPSLTMERTYDNAFKKRNDAWSAAITEPTAKAFKKRA